MKKFWPPKVAKKHSRYFDPIQFNASAPDPEQLQTQCIGIGSGAALVTMRRHRNWSSSSDDGSHYTTHSFIPSDSCALRSCNYSEYSFHCCFMCRLFIYYHFLNLFFIFLHNAWNERTVFYMNFTVLQRKIIRGKKKVIVLSISFVCFIPYF